MYESILIAKTSVGKSLLLLCNYSEIQKSCMESVWLTCVALHLPITRFCLSLDSKFKRRNILKSSFISLTKLASFSLSESQSCMLYSSHSLTLQADIVPVNEPSSGDMITKSCDLFECDCLGHGMMLELVLVSAILRKIHRNSPSLMLLGNRE